MTQQEKAKLFKELHIKGSPLTLTNIWDAGSAKAVAKNGDKALATSSFAVGAAHGFRDSEACPLDLVIANLERITKVVEIPVSLDVEAGYSKTPEGVGETIALVIQAGAIGINLEDQIIGGEGLYSIEEQCERIGAARASANTLDLDLFINARTDVYLKNGPAEQTEEHLQEVIERGNAYAKAGASGFFVPGLLDKPTIKTLCEQVDLPINIMLMDKALKAEDFADLGVSRISTGGLPYMIAMKSFLKE